MIKNQNGVTLTEALVTGIILAILAGGLLSILQLNATETSEGVRSSRLQMQYENIVEQISRNARFAKLILADGEVPDSLTFYPEIEPVYSIKMYDTLYNCFAGYAISSGILKELNTVSGLLDKTYMSGNSSVAIEPSSYFKLFEGRKYLEANLNIIFTYKNRTDTLVSNTNFIGCRN